MTSVSGSEGIFHTPELKVTWKTDSGVKSEEFTEDIIGGRKKDIKDWAKVIQSLKSGKIMIQRLPNPPPSIDSLEGKILHMLGDMQEKGTFEIEEEVESEFKLDIDIDLVEEACEKLASLGLVDKNPDSSGDVFYRKRSPLGEDEYSSKKDSPVSQKEFSEHQHRGRGRRWPDIPESPGCSKCAVVRVDERTRGSAEMV